MASGLRLAHLRRPPIGIGRIEKLIIPTRIHQHEPFLVEVLAHASAKKIGNRNTFMMGDQAASDIRAARR